MTIYDSAELKKRLVEATSFADFFDYYLTNFVEKGHFLSLGRSLSTPRAKFLILAFGEAYGKVSSVVLAAISSRLVEIPELGIIHGTMNVNGKMASVVYFDDVGVGMFTVVENALTGETKYMRFNASRPGRGKPN